MADPGPRAEVGAASRLGKLDLSTSLTHKYPFNPAWIDTSRERKECIQQLHGCIQRVLLPQGRKMSLTCSPFLQIAIK